MKMTVRVRASVMERIKRLNLENNAFLQFADSYKMESDREKIWIGVKDNIMVEGMQLSAGSKIIEGIQVKENATCVQMLENAGFSVLGKTNMDEFGMGSHNVHSRFGPVVNSPKFIANPSARYSAGGSSGGSAAAVASGMCSLALGSDTGGSVRLPASYCAVYGFKPSYGRISRHGLVSYASSLDTIGILSNSIDLVRSAFDRMKMSQAGDMTAWRRTAEVKRKEPFDLKIGVVTEMLPKTNAVDNVELLLASFKRLGTQNIRKISISSVLSALKAYYIISMVEASSCLARYGSSGSVPSIIPADLGFADKTELARELGFGVEVKHRLMMGTALSSEEGKDVYRHAQMMREALRREISETFDDVDLLVCPTAATGPPLLDHVLNPASFENDEWSSDVLTVPASLAGIPAISIPVGPNDSVENSIGVQLMAPFGQDEELLHYASVLGALK